MPTRSDGLPDALDASTSVYESRCLPGYLGVLALDPAGTVIHVTAPLMARLGWNAADWIGRNGFDLLDDEDLEQAAVSFAGTTERGGYHQPLTLRVLCADGGKREMVCVAENLLDDPEIGAIVLSVTDSEEFGRAEVLAIHQATVLELIARDGTLESILGAIAELVESQILGGRAVVLLGSGRRQFEVGAAPSFTPEQVTAFGEIETTDESFLAATTWTRSEALVAPDLHNSGMATMQRLAVTLDAKACWSVPISMVRDEPAIGAIDVYHPDATHPRPDEWSLLRLAARLVALAFEHYTRRAQLTHRAAFDAMTGLANRSTIEERLTEIVVRQEQATVLFLDIDRLKLVNDSLGHAVGDELIRSVAERLDEFAGPGVTVGRFGGDEFVLVVDDPTPEQVDRLANEVLDRLRVPLRLGHRQLSITSSIGVAPISAGMTVDGVLRDADLAMFEAKAAGRDTVRLCTAELRDRAARHLELEAQLREAIEKDEIDVYFQPVVDVRTGAPVSLEALARWRTENGWVSPGDFIPVAEESGLIIPLGKQVLIRACLAARNLDAITPGIKVAVNVSPLQLTSGQMLSTVAAALDAAGLAPERLCLEITEAQMMSRDETITDELAALRRLGVTIAIDDFGTGYSSLAYLRRLPVDVLKVDRAFIEDLHDSGGRAVLGLISTVARELGLGTVAEGVETEDQWDAVCRAGIATVQGFFVARPQPFDDLVDTLQRLVFPQPDESGEMFGFVTGAAVRATVGG